MILLRCVDVALMSAQVCRIDEDAISRQQGECFSQECSVRDINATGQPPCDRISAIA